MGYSKTIFFAPVWFDDFKGFSLKMKDSELWENIAAEKIRPSYLFHYATNIANDSDLFKAFSLKNVENLNVYMYQEEMNFENAPSIEEVRFTAFATGVGFMEFWVSYSDASVREISDFSYLFKKATKAKEKAHEDNKRSLYEVAQSLLPSENDCNIFFSASAQFKYECNCLHFIHEDSEIPNSESVKKTLRQLSRSYKSSMPIANDGTYDMTYEASEGDYWGGSTEGMVNIVYDSKNNESDSSYYYLHSIKPIHLNVDYYFLYLLLLNQKYSALQYIYMVSKVINKSSGEIEKLNKRIIQLKNVFSFNIISDDQHFQNVYSKMFSILEIKKLLADVIENQEQTEFLQNAKHVNADRLSNKYLFGISILSLFSALIDSANYFDRIDGISSVSTALSLVSVGAIILLCVIWAINSIKK